MIDIGEHKCRVHSCESLQAGSGTPFLMVNLEHDDGTVPSLRIYFTRKTTARVKAAMKALGFDYDPAKPDVTPLLADPCPIKGNEVLVEIIMEEYNNQEQMKSELILDGFMGADQEKVVSRMNQILSGEPSAPDEAPGPEDDVPF